MVSKTIIIGRLGQDPDGAPDRNGKDLSKFTVAVTKKFADREPKTVWYSVLAFGFTADFVNKYVRKGDQVYVEGEMDTNEVNGKTYWNLLAGTVQTFNSKRDGGDNSEPNY